VLGVLCGDLVGGDCWGWWKQAPFVVLIGASMPSVLAEISFVTNPQEARLLKSNAYRQSIAEALFNAVRKYQTSLTPRTVASQ
jgi:N-acetylmuramoyl-L-alanine amidase